METWKILLSLDFSSLVLNRKALFSSTKKRMADQQNKPPDHQANPGEKYNKIMY